VKGQIVVISVAEAAQRPDIEIRIDQTMKAFSTAYRIERSAPAEPAR
jgi:hypothetical protein